jgi:hypothetical protein
VLLTATEKTTKRGLWKKEKPKKERKKKKQGEKEGRKKNGIEMCGKEKKEKEGEKGQRSPCPLPPPPPRPPLSSPPIIVSPRNQQACREIGKPRIRLKPHHLTILSPPPTAMINPLCSRPLSSPTLSPTSVPTLCSRFTMERSEARAPGPVTLNAWREC